MKIPKNIQTTSKLSLQIFIMVNWSLSCQSDHNFTVDLQRVDLTFRIEFNVYGEKPGKHLTVFILYDCMLSYLR